MQLKQITIPIENASDRVSTVARALGENGIDLRAINLVDTEAFGELRVLVSDVAGARRILMQAQIPARVDDVVVIEIEDRPGSLADLLARLMENQIQIRYTYALGYSHPGKAVLIFRFNDNHRAIEVLKAQKAVLMDLDRLNRCNVAA
jgi:hypothetical protein